MQGMVVQGDSSAKPWALFEISVNTVVSGTVGSWSTTPALLQVSMAFSFRSVKLFLLLIWLLKQCQLAMSVSWCWSLFTRGRRGTARVCVQRHHSAGLVCSSWLDFSSGPVNYLISESRTLEHPVVHPPPFLYLDSKEETVWWKLSIAQKTKFLYRITDLKLWHVFDLRNTYNI